MDTILILTIFAVGVIINFAIVYLSYLPVARKSCPQKRILQTSGMVVAACALASLAEMYIEQSTAGLSFAVGLVLTYQLGRRMMALSRKQAFGATGIYFGINAVGGVLLFLLYLNYMGNFAH